MLLAANCLLNVVIVCQTVDGVYHIILAVERKELSFLVA